ncbi:hypothetical protein [Neptuniibacter halophilus]|nr:hypothetical protein [Neptuniibacter halophilus]
MMIFTTLLAVGAVCYLLLQSRGDQHSAQPIRVETEEELRRRLRNRR